MALITFDDIRKDSQVRAYLQKADEHLGTMGFTEHGLRHGGLVSAVAKNILESLDYPERVCELTAIAGYLHDIGNVVARADHWVTGASIVGQILIRMGMDYEEIATIIGAVGNHDEHTGEAVNHVAAALIIADKGDVHRSRVRNRDLATFDIHDRVNYAVEKSEVLVDAKERTITLSLIIDTKICPLMEYFEIFLTRMIMSRRAAEFLKCRFGLIINHTKLL
jgi:metal-dependent HD superfamily phosphatase/phosphodiesterase